MSIPILFSADRKFEIPLTIAIASILDTNVEECHFFIVDCGISARGKSRIEALFGSNSIIEWIDPSGLLNDIQMPFYLSEAAAGRLLIDKLPKDLERIVYLDADVLVQTSLRSLYDIDLGNHALAAAQDSVYPFVWKDESIGAGDLDMDLDPNAKYFNSGVLVISVPVWKDLHISMQSFRLLKSFAYAGGDQSALNMVVYQDWIELHPKWNVQTNMFSLNGERTVDINNAIADPAIIHFTESPKPWSPNCRHPLVRKWRDYFDNINWEIR